MSNPNYAETLLQLKEDDLTLRNQLIAEGRLGEGYDRAMEQLHLKNAEALETIIDAIGFPTAQKVGPAASEAAWLVVQHAISKPDFMRPCRDTLLKEVDAGEGDPIQLAYLTDRIAVFEGKPQLYGTQFDWDEGGLMSPQPFDDAVAVDHRRAELGLKSLAEQTRVMRERAVAEGEKAPVEAETRKKAYDAWRIRVGWSMHRGK